MLMTSEDIDRGPHGNSLDGALATQKPAPDDAIIMRPPEKKSA